MPNDDLSYPASAASKRIKALEQELDLFRYIAIVWQNKWLIIAFSGLCGALAMLSVVGKPDIYEAVARVDIVHEGNPGGIDPDNRRTPEAVGLLEHGFVLSATKDNYAQSILARLRSRKFTRHFIETNDVFQLMYSAHWDHQKQAWSDDFEFDRGFAYIDFRDNYRSIWQDPETELVHIGIRHNDPMIATALANKYVADFNNYMRDKALAEVNSKQYYLGELLQQTKVVEMHQMIYRLMEAQTAAAMLANGREEYALEILDPAVRPYDRYSPRRKRTVILGVIAGGLFSCFALIGIALVRDMQRRFAVYYAGYMQRRDRF